MKTHTMGRGVNKPKVCNVKLSDLNNLLKENATVPVCIKFARAMSLNTVSIEGVFSEEKCNSGDNEEEYTDKPIVTEFE